MCQFTVLSRAFPRLTDLSSPSICIGLILPFRLTVRLRLASENVTPHLKKTVARLMLFLGLVHFGLTGGSMPAIGQCCGGASDSVVYSPDGRFRVEATSLTGTGHSSHGPYRYRFRTLRVGPGGETEVVGVFDRAWNNDNHFGMTICVSPTGNGFALSTTLEKSILFMSPDGEILAKIDEHASAAIKPCKKNTSIVRTLYGRTQYGLRETKLWIPLFHITGPETAPDLSDPEVITENIGFKTVPQEEICWLQKMLRWRASVGEREADRVRDLLEQSDEAGLVELGLSALPHLKTTLETNEQISLRRARQEIIRRLCGHENAWRNLDLLIVLCEHPNQSLQETAREQLRALLPNGEPTADWIKQNREHLNWDAGQNLYRLSAE